MTVGFDVGTDTFGGDRTGKTESPNQGPQLLNRAFEILGLFTPESPEWTTTDSARACDLPVPTAHRILSALWRLDYVSRDDLTKRFRLGPAALELGRHARASTDLQTVCVPVLRRLADASGETVLLTALSLDRRQSVCMERVESRNPLRLSVEPGHRMPLHAGASQKALLAYMTQDEIDDVTHSELPSLCRSTITDRDALLTDLEAIRRRGWSTSYEETDLGLWGIAITLLDARGEVVAAIGLAGPRVRLPKSRADEILMLLKEGAADIAATLALRTSIQGVTESRRRDGDDVGVQSAAQGA